MLGFLIINLIAVIGYYIFFVLILKQKEAFFPFAFISFTVVLIYLFGCAELLSLGFLAVILIGMCLLGVSIMCLYKKREKLDLQSFFNPTLIFMLGGIVWCYVLSRGIYPSHYDDFSHWFKICKTIYADSSYPNTAECYFQNYVPGTATWIWYVTGIIGYSPQNCYFAQMVLNLSCCCALLSAIGRDSDHVRKIVVTVFCSVLSVVLCAMDVTVYSLLVDGLLGLAASAGVIYVAASEKEGVAISRFLILLVMCCFIALIKASGGFLICFVAAAYFASLKGLQEKKDKIKRAFFAIITVILPFLITQLYIIRAKIVFGAETWKQGSVEEYSKVVERWDVVRYTGIIKKFLKECFNIGYAWPQIRIMWVVILAIFGISIVKRVKKEKNSQWSFIKCYVPIVTVIWLLGVLFTFFTFEERDANSDMLVSFERYAGTMSIFAVEVFTFYCLNCFLAMSGKKRFLLGTGVYAVMSVAASLLVGFHLMYIFGFKYYDFKMFSPDVWIYLEEYYPERWDFNDDGYVMLIDVEQKDFDNCYKLHHVITTYFRTTNCNVYDIKELEEAGFTIEDVREAFPNIVYYNPNKN